MQILVEPLVGLGVLLTLVALLLTNAAYRYTLGLLLAAIASVFDSVSIRVPVIGKIGLGSIGDAIRALNNSILHALGVGIQSTEWAWHKFWHWTAYAIEHPGRVLGDLAEATESALTTLRRYTIPLVVGVTLGPTAALVALLRKQVAHLLAQAAHLGATIISEVPKVITRVEHVTTTVVKTVTVSVPAAVAKAVAIPLPKIRTVEVDTTRLWNRVKRIADTLTPAGIVGLVGAAVLAKLGLGSLKCSNNQDLSKALCRTDRAFIDNLLVDALAIVGTLSLIDAATEMQGLIGEAAPEIRRFWRVANPAG